MTYPHLSIKTMKNIRETLLQIEPSSEYLTAKKFFFHIVIVMEKVAHQKAPLTVDKVACEYGLYGSLLLTAKNVSPGGTSTP